MKIKEKANHVRRRIFTILSRNEMLILPGQLAFFLLLAIVPTITLIAYVASFFHVSTDFLSSFMGKAFGSSVVSLIVPMVQDINFSFRFLVLIFFAFYASSGGTSSIIVTSNHLYHFKNTPFLHRKIKSILMIMILIVLIVFLLLIPVIGNRFVAMLEYVGVSETIVHSVMLVLQMMRSPLAWFLIFFLIKIIYTMAPDEHIPSSWTTKGSLFTTIGILLVTYLYSLYVTYVAHYDVLYGGLAHFVILMIWLYLLSYIVVIGIAFNVEEYENRKKLDS